MAQLGRTGLLLARAQSASLRAADRRRSCTAESFRARSKQLAQLPGIGRSTAAAIAALAFGERAAILDGNVRRVLARHCGIDGFPGRPQIERQFWQRAESLLPSQQIERYTQGLMDLGATVCTRSRPNCAACPVNDTLRRAQRADHRDSADPAPGQAAPDASADGAGDAGSSAAQCCWSCARHRESGAGF